MLQAIRKFTELFHFPDRRVKGSATATEEHQPMLDTFEMTSTRQGDLASHKNRATADFVLQVQNGARWESVAVHKERLAASTDLFGKMFDPEGGAIGATEFALECRAATPKVVNALVDALYGAPVTLNNADATRALALLNDWGWGHGEPASHGVDTTFATVRSALYTQVTGRFAAEVANLADEFSLNDVTNALGLQVLKAKNLTGLRAATLSRFITLDLVTTTPDGTAAIAEMLLRWRQNGGDVQQFSSRRLPASFAWQALPSSTVLDLVEAGLLARSPELVTVLTRHLRNNCADDDVSPLLGPALNCIAQHYSKLPQEGNTPW